MIDRHLFSSDRHRNGVMDKKSSYRQRNLLHVIDRGI